MEEVIERMLELIGIEAALMVLPRLCERGLVKIRELQAAAMETMGLKGPLTGFEPVVLPAPTVRQALLKPVRSAPAKTKVKTKVMSKQHRDAISKGRQAGLAKKGARWTGPPRSLQDIGEEPTGARSLSEVPDESLHTATT